MKSLTQTVSITVLAFALILSRVTVLFAGEVGRLPGVPDVDTILAMFDKGEENKRLANGFLRLLPESDMPALRAAWPKHRYWINAEMVRRGDPAAIEFAAKDMTNGTSTNQERCKQLIRQSEINNVHKSTSNNADTTMPDHLKGGIRCEHFRLKNEPSTRRLPRN